MMPTTEGLAQITERLTAISLEVALLVALIAAAALVCRRASPALRHALWCVVLLRLCWPAPLTTPAGLASHARNGAGRAASWVRTTEIGGFGDQTDQTDRPVETASGMLPEADAAARLPGVTLTPALEQSAAPQEAAPSSPNRAVYPTDPTDPTNPTDPSDSFPPAPRPSTLHPAAWPARAAAVWLIIAAALAGLVVARAVWVSHILRRCPELERGGARQVLEDGAARLGLRRRIVLRVSDRLAAPAAFGLWRPTILLPRAMAETWSAEDLEPVLLHELSHIRRGDLFINAVQIAVQIAYWFHPLVWWANSRIRRLREEACDDLAISALGGSRRPYSASVLRAMEQTSRAPAIAFAGLGFAEPRTRLGRRIERIMSAKYEPTRNLKTASLAGLAAVALVTVALAADRTSEVSPMDNPPAEGSVSETPNAPPFTGQTSADGNEAPLAEDSMADIQEASPSPFKTLEEAFIAGGREDPREVFPDYVLEAEGIPGFEKPLDFIREILGNIDPKESAQLPLFFTRLSDALQFEYARYRYQGGGATSVGYFLLPSSEATKDLAKAAREWADQRPSMATSSFSVTSFQNILILIINPDANVREAFLKHTWDVENYAPPGARALFDYGQSLIQENRNESALLAFEEIYRRWPEWQEAGQALIYVALCYENLGQKDVAAYWYKIILRDYPHLKSAANEGLDRVGRTLIRIVKEGQILVNGETVAAADLLDTLKRMRNTGSKGPIWIIASPEAKAEIFIGAISACREAGFADIGFKGTQAGSAASGYYYYGNPSYRPYGYAAGPAPQPPAAPFSTKGSGDGRSGY